MDNPSTNRHRGVPARYRERADIVTAFFRGETSCEAAAAKLAAGTIPDGKLANADYERLWSTLIIIAYDFPDDLARLAELLVTIANLPPVKDHEGNEVEVWCE